VDLAKVPPPPLTPEEDAFDKVMKRVGPAFNELRAAATASNADAVAERAKVLKGAFAEAEVFWKARKAADAIAWTRTARTQLTALERAAAAGWWEQVKTAVADVNRMCSTCHTAYRERLEDGTFRVKSAATPR
jgi:cytochrome c556